MARLLCGMVVFLAGFALLIVNAEEDKISSDKDLLIKDSEPDHENAADRLEEQTTTRRKRSHFWSWGRRRRRRRRSSFVVRPHCEHKDHDHFRTRCCSGKFIDKPLLQTCCAGRIVLKKMVPFFCHPLYGCGCFWYDPNRQKCCYGLSNLGCREVQPVCGLASYSPSVQACCDGRYTYVISHQKCCHRRVISNSRRCRF